MSPLTASEVRQIVREELAAALRPSAKRPPFEASFSFEPLADGPAWQIRRLDAATAEIARPASQADVGGRPNSEALTPGQSASPSRDGLVSPDTKAETAPASPRAGRG
jgi:hypothetical protein